jgi:hypothetical protein
VALPLRHPNRQRLQARFLGIDGRAELLNGSGGRGVAPMQKKGNRYDSAPKEVTRRRASGGARGGGQDPVMTDPIRLTRSSEREQQVEVVATLMSDGVWLGLTL